MRGILSVEDSWRWAISRSLSAVLILGLLGGTGISLGQAAPGSRAVQPTPGPADVHGFKFRFETPSLEATSEADGDFAIQLEGFATRELRSGAPDIPVRIVRVAIPEGVVPRLEIVSAKNESRPGIRPRPVATEVPDYFGEGAGLKRRSVREKNPAYYDAPRGTLDRIAWLGEIGTFRDQRYVELYLAPVRFDQHVDGLRVATSFEVTVHFDGDVVRRTHPTLDPRFESVYRNMFVNYGQGMTFRISHEDPGTASAIAAATLAPASGPIQRIKVRQNGVVRLDFTRMSGTTGFLPANLSTWKLTNRGVEVPLEIKDVNANDLMDSGDWVQFYGQALDDEPKAVLNTDLPGNPTDLFEARDFTDENTYFLSIVAGARARMTTLPSAPTMTRTPPTDFQAIAHAELDSPTSLGGFRPLGGADPWYWAPGQSNPAQGGENANPRTVSVNLPGLASGTLPAHVLVRLRAGTEDSATFPDHHSQVILKDNQGAGSTLKTDNDNQTWDGRTLYTHDFTWTYPGSGPVLTNPAQVTLQVLPVSGSVGYANEFILDWIEIQYRALFQATGDALTFDYPDGDGEFIVSGLASSTPEVWEVTGRVPSSNVVRPVLLTSPAISGVGPFSVRFRVDNDPTLPDGTPRRFVVFGTGGLSTPANPDFQADTVSDLRQNTNQADLIVIAHPTVLGALSQPTLNQLLSYHASTGITSKIVLIGDVQDEFNDGLPGPVAIKNFLRWVMSTTPGEGWADPKPSYVLLLGDGSYDYKGGTAQGNFVPTQLMFRDDFQLGYYASDNVMAAVVGDDQLADLVVGRLPGRTDAEANTMLLKILNYEQGAPSGNWRRHAIFIADRGKRDGSGTIDQGEVANFEGMGDLAESWMKRPPHTDAKFYYYTTYCSHPAPPTPESCTPNAIRNDIKSAVNDPLGGAAVVQTAAHGNFDVWSDDAFWDDRTSNPFPDTSDLTNGGRLPWMIAHGCLTGGFHTTAGTALGEDWIKKSGGGALAVFAPSDLTFTYLGNTVADSIFHDLYGPPKERTIAVPVMDAIATLCGQGSTEACQGYVLMGDPATDLVIPAVGPAQNVVATGGNTRVDLTWGASTTAGAKYDIYRSVDLVHFPLTKINALPVTGLTYADTGLENARTYNYAVVAFDASGFESRWSHFNSDCAVSGPDCLEATPLNPSAPNAPAGLVATDPEVGGRLNLSWSANAEPDLSFYEIHYGTSPGAYTAVVNVGKVTSYPLLGLQTGTTYYIAITATNTSSLTSTVSQEATGKPTWVRGVKSPQFIADLRLAKSGSDIVVSWNAVTTTIYGKAATIARYEIYRGTSPTFIPGAGNLISPPSLTGTSFTDLNAASAGTNYYYLARAVDLQGNGGGLGNQLPMGIDVLAEVKSTSTPGNIVLSWPAVTTEFSPGSTPGNPLAIGLYEIYARSTPFTRADIRDGSVTLLTTTAATSIDLTPLAPTQYYSVLAVDARGNKSPF